MALGPHRLSSYVLFIDWGEHVEVRHTATGRSFVVTRAQHEHLLLFSRFRETTADESTWIEACVLVPPGGDSSLDLVPGSEASLARAVSEWYWAHEIESEREYRWLGWPIVKSPSEVFFYQELIARRHIRSVLEIGSGDGGGLWFFATVLSHLEGGLVVGIERAPPIAMPAFERVRGVIVRPIHGDARYDDVRARVGALAPGYDLVVVDVGADAEEMQAHLRSYKPLLADRGVIVLEDASAVDMGWLDEVLLEDRSLGMLQDAARHPFLKGRGAVLERQGVGASPLGRMTDSDRSR